VLVPLDLAAHVCDLRLDAGWLPHRGYYRKFTTVLYRRAVLIYNPAAGRRRGRRARDIERAMEILREQVEEIDARATAGPGSATELARQACRSSADLVLASGGDGTINEVVNGLAGSSVPLAVLPAGTANVLAVLLGLPLEGPAAARLLPQLRPQRLSLGRVRCDLPAPGSSRYFLLLAGAGLDAQIIYTLSGRLKSRLGVAAYWLAGFGQLGRRLESFEVEVEGRRYACTFALASQSAYYGGGLQIARRAHLLAGELEIVLFHSRSSFRYLLYLGAVISRTLEQLPDVTFLRARSLDLRAVEGPPVRIEVDGELAGRLPARIDLVPDALTLLVPEAYLEAHPARG
jgi:YegS/Rv2252/BmrU family lipid kinase